MTIFADIWRLPGPGGFVQEVARLARGGQHVLAIVPKYVAEESEYSDALAVAILNELGESRRVFPNAKVGGLAGAFGFEVSDDFDRYPTTVPELINHVDVVGRTFVCNTRDLDPAHLAELPTFLSRLDDESRPVPRTDRGTMIFILSSDLVPHDAESVATARLWYWDRVARWDVAALLASQTSWHRVSGVLGEVRLETIIEIARWDFILALDIAHEWTHDEFELSVILDRHAANVPASTVVRRTAQKEPPELNLTAWDQGLVEAWHGEPGYKPATLPSTDRRLERLLWSAQARVLLPWIEIRRVSIERLVLEKLGSRRMESAVRELATSYPGAEDDSTVVEIALLARIIAVRLGNAEPRLRTTARVLRDARNKLAHLTPLPSGHLDRMISECAWLDEVGG